MSCTSPAADELINPRMWPFDVPFSVALNQDQFDPWTETPHKFRYFENPYIESIDPIEVQVGLTALVEVTISNDEDDPDFANVFYETLPTNVHNDPNIDPDDELALTLFGNVGGSIRCKFGRFGETIGVYVNSTNVRCFSPSVNDDPEDIYRETVDFQLSMNGFDYDDRNEDLEFAFVGTGSSWGLGPVVLTILLLGALAAAFIVYV